MRCHPRWVGYRGVTKRAHVYKQEGDLYEFSVALGDHSPAGHSRVSDQHRVRNQYSGNGDRRLSLVIIFYRVAVRLIPRILQGRSPYSSSRDAAVRSRIKRLRYVTFAIGTIVVVSIFLRDVLPGIPVAILAVFLAADIMFGFLRR